jgi:hypothetical protein
MMSEAFSGNISLLHFVPLKHLQLNALETAVKGTIIKDVTSCNTAEYR